MGDNYCYEAGIETARTVLITVTVSLTSVLGRWTNSLQLVTF